MPWLTWAPEGPGAAGPTVRTLPVGREKRGRGLLQPRPLLPAVALRVLPAAVPVSGPRVICVPEVAPGCGFTPLGSNGHDVQAVAAGAEPASPAQGPRAHSGQPAGSGGGSRETGAAVTQWLQVQGDSGCTTGKRLPGRESQEGFTEDVPRALGLEGETESLGRGGRGAEKGAFHADGRAAVRWAVSSCPGRPRRPRVRLQTQLVRVHLGGDGASWKNSTRFSKRKSSRFVQVQNQHVNSDGLA